jgi:hypothetical protein
MTALVWHGPIDVSRLPIVSHSLQLQMRARRGAAGRGGAACHPEHAEEQHRANWPRRGKDSSYHV